MPVPVRRQTINSVAALVMHLVPYQAIESTRFESAPPTDFPLMCLHAVALQELSFQIWQAFQALVDVLLLPSVPMPADYLCSVWVMTGGEAILIDVLCRVVCAYLGPFSRKSVSLMPLETQRS